MRKTTTPNKSEITREWHLIDVRGKILGKVATEIATLLIGKNKASFTPNINVGDNVIVVNASEVAVTGTKLDSKIYHRPTGYPGSVKSISLGNLLEKSPEEVIRRAVKGMLPKNKLQKERLNSLHIYPGSEHPHQGQVK